MKKIWYHDVAKRLFWLQANFYFFIKLINFDVFKKKKAMKYKWNLQGSQGNHSGNAWFNP